MEVVLGVVDLYLTDPPYNVNYEGGTGLKIENDNMSNSEFKTFLTDAFTNAYSVMKEGAAFYVWYASREHVNFETALNDAGLKVRQ
jgi:DNA modification methylase